MYMGFHRLKNSQVMGWILISRHNFVVFACPLTHHLILCWTHIISCNRVWLIFVVCHIYVSFVLIFFWSVLQILHSLPLPSINWVDISNIDASLCTSLGPMRFEQACWFCLGMWHKLPSQRCIRRQMHANLAPFPHLCYRATNHLLYHFVGLCLDLDSTRLHFQLTRDAQRTTWKSYFCNMSAHDANFPTNFSNCINHFIGRWFIIKMKSLQYK